MKRIKLFIAAFALLAGISGGFMATAAVSAATAQQTVCETLEAGSDCKTTPHGNASINGVIGALINLLSFIVGLLAVIMIIVSGFKYVTAGGDSSKITSAKNTLIYAIVGVAIAALAQIIVKFVLNKLK